MYAFYWLLFPMSIEGREGCCFYSFAFVDERPRRWGKSQLHRFLLSACIPAVLIRNKILPKCIRNGLFAQQVGAECETGANLKRMTLSVTAVYLPGFFELAYGVRDTPFPKLPPIHRWSNTSTSIPFRHGPKEPFQNPKPGKSSHPSFLTGCCMEVSSHFLG